jgi:Kef-type K+ transport system membrane component KefB
MGANLQLAIKVVAALFVILLATMICGRLARAVGQPRVVGEMVAGVLLGPVVFGAIVPGLQASLFPKDVNSVLYVLSTIGLTFFMFLVGATLDHRSTGRRSVRRSTTLAVSGIIPPFALGVVAALVFYDRLAAPGSSRALFALFLGGALAITAFPVLARILQERDMTGSRIGSLTLMAAAVDDAFAWGLLAVIIALAEAGSMAGALITILGAGLFAVIMLTVGRRALTPLARRVERTGAITHGQMAAVVLLVVFAGWFTDLIGVFSVFGGFITGLAMPHSAVLRRELRNRLMDMNAILLVPVFFAYTGLNTRFSAGGDLGLLPPLLVIVLFAFAGKYLGCGLTARRLGLPWRHASAVGGLMNARGLMIMVFITIGLAHNLITQQVFSILVLIAVVTSAAALPIYRLSLPRELEDAERAQEPLKIVPAQQPDARTELAELEEKYGRPA